MTEPAAWPVTPEALLIRFSRWLAERLPDDWVRARLVQTSNEIRAQGTMGWRFQNAESLTLAIRNIVHSPNVIASLLDLLEVVTDDRRGHAREPSTPEPHRRRARLFA